MSAIPFYLKTDGKIHLFHSPGQSSRSDVSRPTRVPRSISKQRANLLHCSKIGDLRDNLIAIHAFIERNLHSDAQNKGCKSPLAQKIGSMCKKKGVSQPDCGPLGRYRDAGMLEHAQHDGGADFSVGRSKAAIYANLTISPCDVGTSGVAKVAETARFELAVRFAPYDGLANRWFQPLTHVSALFWWHGGL
jgi:hypothetical protein